MGEKKSHVIFFLFWEIYSWNFQKHHILWNDEQLRYFNAFSRV
jgi:hypothetical protein